MNMNLSKIYFKKNLFQISLLSRAPSSPGPSTDYIYAYYSTIFKKIFFHYLYQYHQYQYQCYFFFIFIICAVIRILTFLYLFFTVDFCFYALKHREFM